MKALAASFLILGVLALTGSVLSWIHFDNEILIRAESWLPLFFLIPSSLLASYLYLCLSKGSDSGAVRQVAWIFLGAEIGLLLLFALGASWKGSL